MEFCDFELEERPPSASTKQTSDNSETVLQCIPTVKEIPPE